MLSGALAAVGAVQGALVFHHMALGEWGRPLGSDGPLLQVVAASLRAHTVALHEGLHGRHDGTLGKQATKAVRPHSLGTHVSDACLDVLLLTSTSIPLPLW
jgi:hypothetical protein